MQKLWPFLLIVVSSNLASAAELAISSKEPVVVAVPDKWKAEPSKTKPDAANFPFETYQITPPRNRNALCLISILDKDRPQFATREFLTTVLQGDSRPYVADEQELSKLQPKQLRIKDGVGMYLNFVDPDLAGKPVIKGKYKTATPMLLAVGKRYVIKATILCDEIDGPDYGDLMKIVQSVHVKAK